MIEFEKTAVINTEAPCRFDVLKDEIDRRDSRVDEIGRVLAMADFIRLFLTVIAHNLSIARSEQFLKMFRYLVPSLYETSARSVLQDG